jgi:glycosyltransferase involved in cell wall biosynthesis
VRIVTRLNRGGPLRQLEALVPGLAARGVAGPVWTGEPADGEEDASDVLRRRGVEVEVVPGLRRLPSPAADAAAWRWMGRRLRETRPDVVHTHLAKAGALGRLAARAARVPVRVHTFHGHHLTATLPARAAIRAAERRLARLSTAVVCLSRSQREDLVVRHRVVPADRAVVIGPGIDVEGFRASVDPRRARSLRVAHAPRDGVLLVWLGRFVAVKDPLLAAAAARRAAERSPVPLRLAMMGDGPLRASLREDGVVVLPGPVADAADWIAASDALLLSSRSEGTPVAAVEAACLGRPVVATDVGGVADVVTAGETGLLVAPSDEAALAAAITRLAGDPALRARLGAAASASAPSRFGADRLVSETAALYASCLARTKR